MKKRFTLIFSALILALSLLALTSLSSAESNVSTSLNIAGFTLDLKDNIAINCKVTHENLSSEYVDDIKILVWEEVPESYTANDSPCETLAWLGKDSSGYETFRCSRITAKEMTKELYFCAYVKAGDTEIYSAPKKYSILTYAYNKINAANPNANLVALCQSVLDYGAMAQTYLGYETDFLANDTVYKVSVSNGTFENGFTSGIYQNGSTVTLKSNPAESGYTFSHWQNNAGEIISKTPTVTIEVTSSEKYTAVYAVGEFSQHLKYTLNNDGLSYSVAGIGQCPDTDIIIPSTYNDGLHGELPVTAIAYQAFYQKKSLTSITMPDSITSIGDRAFDGCVNIESIKMSESLTYIGSEAFYFCQKLASIKLPSSLTKIGGYAFSYCVSLKSIIIPEGITIISGATFDNCENLEYIVLPSTLEKIGANAFRDCDNLKYNYYAGNNRHFTGNVYISEPSGSDNSPIKNAKTYYYSETVPSESGNFWRYVDGIPTSWY